MDPTPQYGWGQQVEALFERVEDTSNAGTAVNLDTTPVQPGEYWKVYSADFFNSSGESVTVSFNIVDGVRVIQLQGVQTVNNGEAASLNSFKILGVGCKLRAIVTGTANKKQIDLLVTGERISTIRPDQAYGRGQSSRNFAPADTTSIGAAVPLPPR